MNNPKRVLALVCLAIAIVTFCQIAGWNPRNVPCVFILTPTCAATQLNHSATLRTARQKVQAIGNIKYVGPNEALVDYLYESQDATAADEANPDSSQIKLAAFRRVFYRWRLEQ
jgi:hypothetical protein